MSVDDIALTMTPEIGSRTAIHLMECFGSAQQLYEASAAEIILRAEVRPSLAEAISHRAYHKEAARELEWIESHGLRAIAADDADYPQRLRECPDYPHVLYLRGTTDLNAGHWLSIVGTRAMTPYGAHQCERLVGDLAALCPDTVIVSGLAYGVDITAHRAALDARLTTIGVVAHPLNRIYPTQHAQTARSMVDHGGAILSEYHRACPMDRANFVQRNRIVAGLSEGTLIIESPRKGGSLITADMADGYDRTVMALPGRVDDPSSEGCNHLIRTLKAQMIGSADELVETLGWSCATATPAPRQVSLFEQTLPPVAAAVLSHLDPYMPLSAEELSIRCALTPQELAPILLDLELAGTIRTVRGSFYIKHG